MPDGFHHKRSSGWGVWIWVGLICFVGSWWPVFVFDQVADPLGSPFALVLLTCGGSWLLLTALIGFLGGRRRNWFVTLIGVTVMSVGVHFGAYVYHTFRPATDFLGDPIKPHLLPTQEDLGEAFGLLVTGLFAAAIGYGLAHRTMQRLPAGHCQACGYNLTGNVSGRCPECGEAIKQTV
jgi:hypothetical protein